MSQNGLGKSAAVIVAAILLFSVFSVLTLSIKPAEAQQAPQLPQLSQQAQSLPREQRNWEYLNGDAWGQNYNPQNQLNKDNVQFLELKWIYPIPTVTQQAGRFQGFASVNEGSMAPPLVVDGVMYTVLNSKMVLAIDAKTGKEVWRWVNSFDNRNINSSLPVLSGYQIGHTHGIHYVDGKIWLNDFGCQVTALDAKTGKSVRNYTNLCREIPMDSPQGMGIPTNSGFYAGAGGHPPSFYNRENIMIWTIGGASEGTWGGRSYVAGHDITTGQLKWRFFYIPPCGDPATCKPLFQREKQEWGNWLVQNCNKIWIQGIKSCTLDQDLLRNDFGNMRFNSGVSNVWGTYVVDQETGILYFGTAQAGPDWNATHAPGFRLFGASVLALNARNGELVWAHQTTARDLWDYDCSWNTILTNAKVKGQDKKVVIKACKNGFVHVLDAATGEKLHLLESPDIKRTPEQLLGNPEWNGRLFDPRNKDHMTKPWTNYPSKDAFFFNCPVTGCLESDIAYDPVRNMVFAGTYNSPTWARITGADPRGVSLGGQLNPANFPKPFEPKINMTINAWDLNTGELKWRYFIDKVGFRGGVIVSGGLVWFAATDGFAKALDADTGKVLYEANLGISQLVQPTIAADADGKIKLFRVVGGHAFFANILGPQGSGSNVPGAIMAYGLPDTIPAPKEIIKEVPKEVIKEVPKEVIKEVTVETVSPVSYGIVGLGIVIAVIGIVMSRRKKA